MTTERNAQKKIKPSHETLCAVLSYLANESPVLSEAMRHVGHQPGTIWTWIKRARETDPAIDDRWMCRFPDPEGEPVAFDQGVVLARQMSIAILEATLRRDCITGRPMVARTADGAVIYEVDYLAVAQFSDADEAYALGGIVDWPFLHDERGARVPVITREIAPAALRQHVARSIVHGYNPSNNVAQDVKHSGGVMIVRASTQKQIATPPPYSREAMASEGEAMSPLKRDLLQRLATIRANGPTNPRPIGGPAFTGSGRPGGDDPPEGIGH